MTDLPEGFHILTPAKQNRFLEGLHFDGSMCIATVVSGAYQWYIPLFVSTMMLAYPDYTVKVLLRGENELINDQEIWNFVSPFVIEIPEERGWIDSGFFTAALRFLEFDNYFGPYDYTLITDIDILTEPCSVSLIDQHMRSIVLNQTECYSNYLQHSFNDIPVMPGIHFVTRAWWDRTKNVRREILQEIINSVKCPNQTDEISLAKIVYRANLPLPSEKPNLWATHGIHLGNYRKGHKEIHHTKLINDLAKNGYYSYLVDECSKKLPELMEIYREFRKVIIDDSIPE